MVSLARSRLTCLAVACGLAACGDGTPVQLPDPKGIDELDEVVPDESDDDGEVIDRPQRQHNAACGAFERPTSSTLALVPAFPALQFDSLTALAAVPGSARWLAGTKDGRVWSFADDADSDSADVFLDLTDRTLALRDAGLVGIAPHPAFARNGIVYVSYTAPGGPVLQSRISRFRSRDGRRADPRTEEVLLTIDQDSEVHVNADLRFGPDGYLYIGFGDGGPQGDPYGRAQDTYDLRGKILRIDVDGAAPYDIPDDNPFARGGGAPEVFAYGLRNPWRMSFDRATGELWLGDVGWDWIEEVNRVPAGGNLGWPMKEGTRCIDVYRCEDEDLVDPIAVYDHRFGVSVTGGFVYRGDALPELAGTYVYGDFAIGSIWGVPADSAGTVERQVLVDGRNTGVVGFAEDDAGELLAYQHQPGTIYRIVARTPENAAKPPPTLSATGCFDRDQPGAVAAGVVAYDVNAPLWSDGLDKRRWLAVPDDTQIAIDDTGHLVFARGTVLVKEFAEAGHRVETRLLVHHGSGEWAGYAYRWNPEQTEAFLVPAEGADITLPSGHPWRIPGSGECQQCHTAAAGTALGLELGQLNRPRAGDPRGRNQLQWLSEAGYLGTPLPAVDALPLLPGLDDPAPIASRARAYLHANCAHCHRPGGAGQGGIDLRATTPLDATDTCDRLPALGDLGLPDARVVAPGAPERSVLLARLVDDSGMPPLGTFRTDQHAVSVIEAWIAALDGCAD